MKQLNKKSTRIFLKLIQKLGTQDCITLQVEEFMPLHVELLQSVETETGVGKLYSIAHTYVQNGDLMRDPEMCFIAVPATDNTQLFVFPQMYQQDSIGLYEESVHITDGKVTGSIPLWQQSHCAFANMWLLNIVAQGFLK